MPLEHAPYPVAEYLTWQHLSSNPAVPYQSTRVITKHHTLTIPSFQGKPLIPKKAQYGCNLRPHASSASVSQWILAFLSGIPLLFPAGTEGVLGLIRRGNHKGKPFPPVPRREREREWRYGLINFFEFFFPSLLERMAWMAGCLY